jgi:pimeloyl-ACP methyl ester carboxylesterase
MKCQFENITVNYQTIGQGRPILLLHGYWLDHRQMLGCMEPVLEGRNGYRRIYLDLPGMGRTPGADWITNSDQMLEVVCQFIEAVIPDQPFLIGGYSYGAYLAQAVLQRKFERVDGLFLVCPVIVATSSQRKVPPHEILIQDEKLITRLTPEEIEEVNNWMAVQSLDSWERTRNEVGAGFELADVQFLTRLQSEGYACTFDVGPLAKPFDKPSLIINGRQDWVVGYRDAWEVLESYKRATFAVLDRAGHNLPIVQAGLFNALVNEWLDRVEEYLTS